MKTIGRPILIAILVCAGLTPFACSENQEATRSEGNPAPASPGEFPPLYDGLGTHRTTSEGRARCDDARRPLASGVAGYGFKIYRDAGRAGAAPACSRLVARQEVP